MRFPGRNISSHYLFAFCVYTLAAVSLHAEAATRAEAAKNEGKPVARSTFFPRENPKEIFDENVAEVDQYGIVMLRAKQEVSSPQPLKQVQAKKKIDENAIPQSKEEIEEMFGSPDEAEPLKAHKDAPRPFKAMMAALNIGDDELAYKYSKKWVSYLDTIDKAANDVTGLTGKVMKGNQILNPDADWADSERYARFDGIIHEDIKRELESPDGKVESLLRFVPKNIKEEVSSKEVFLSESEELFYDNAKARAQLRESLKSIVPSFGDTRVDVYFFFQPGKKYSNLMAKEIDEFNSNIKKNGRVNLIAVTNEPVSKEQYNEFKQSTGIHFNALTTPSKLNEIFEVSNSPEVVIHLPELNKRIHEKGLRKAFYLEEVVAALTSREEK